MRLFEGTPFDIPPKCERCGALESECQCVPLPDYLPPEKQTAKIRTEKRAKGKLVTVISGLSPTANDHEQLIKTLKAACGAGGCSKDGLLEVQGEHVSRVESTLLKLGYKVKRG